MSHNQNDNVEASEQITRNNHRLSSFALGLQGIGVMMYQHDDSAGLSDDTKAQLGYLIEEIGTVMLETMNENTRIETSRALSAQSKSK